jgi:hypothetical protein
MIEIHLLFATKSHLLLLYYLLDPDSGSDPNLRPKSILCKHESSEDLHKPKEDRRGMGSNTPRRLLSRGYP